MRRISVVILAFALVGCATPEATPKAEVCTLVFDRLNMSETTIELFRDNLDKPEVARDAEEIGDHNEIWDRLANRLAR